MSVSRAVKKGTLVQSVVRDAKGKPMITDPELADREWAANCDYSKAPPEVKEKGEATVQRLAQIPDSKPVSRAVTAVPGAVFEGGEVSLSNASAREKHWRAESAQLEYRREAGELVEAREVQATVASAFATVRTRLLGVPSRMKQQRPDLEADDIAAFTACIREALEELASTKAEDLE